MELLCLGKPGEHGPNERRLKGTDQLPKLTGQLTYHWSDRLTGEQSDNIFNTT
jgi:hypothetical protein